jgi:hypothetical protein
MAYWWCLDHRRVEEEDGCAHAKRLGPFETPEEASHAIEHAAQRSKDWDEQEKEWDSR